MTCRMMTENPNSNYYQAKIGLLAQQSTSSSSSSGRSCTAGSSSPRLPTAQRVMSPLAKYSFPMSPPHFEDPPQVCNTRCNWFALELCISV